MIIAYKGEYVELFSYFALTDGGDRADLELEVGGDRSVATHVDNNKTGGHTDGAVAIVRCDAGEQVVVKSTQDGTTISATYAGHKTAAFSGSLLHAL